MKLVSGISLMVSVALFAQAWAGQPDTAPDSADSVTSQTPPAGSQPVSGQPVAASDPAPQATPAPEVDPASQTNPALKSAPAPALKTNPARTATIRWQSDLKVAHELSVELNRPLLIVFDADWCSYCRRMERTTLADPKLIAQVNGGFIPVHLDLDEHARVAEILEVKRIPCTVVLSPRADLLGRLTGYVTVDQYIRSLGRVLDLHRKVDKQLVTAAR